MIGDRDEVSVMRPSPRLLRNVGLGAVLVLVVTACGGSTAGSVVTDSTFASVAVSVVQTPTVAGDATEAESVAAAQVAPDAMIAAAVDALVQSAAYSFKSTVTLTVQGAEIQSELEGWVDGPDRQITLRIAEAEVTTRVIDGVATVERDGAVTEVSLTEAADAPSLQILRSIRNPTFVDGGVEGKLSGRDLADSGYEVNGSATATVLIAADGTLGGYEIWGSNESWLISVTFTDL